MEIKQHTIMWNSWNSWKLRNHNGDSQKTTWGIWKQKQNTETY